MRRIAWILALSLAGLCASSLHAASGPVTIEDLVSLLQAKVGESVILRQVGASGLSFGVGVPEILRLKEAGASDSLIETLMRLKPATPEDVVNPSMETNGPSHPFRIFKETTPDGQEFLHITNMDASGRRIGGEDLAEEPAPRNRYESRGREAGAEDARREEAYSVIGEPAAASPPVVVNVYPPAPQIAPAYDGGYVSPYMYRDPYSYLYPRGRLPGYYPGAYFRTWGVPSPPGSYSHFMRFHTHYGGGSFTGCATTGGCVAPAAPQTTYLGPHYRPIGPASAMESLARIRSGVGRDR